MPQHKTSFEIENDNHLRTALSVAIWKLVPLDIPPENLIARAATLSHHERLFLAVDMFDANACANGTAHFFYYGYGVLLPYVLDGLREIGASDTATGLQEYVQAVFGESLPQEEETMQGFLHANEVPEELADKEFAYYRQTYEVVRLLVAWARSNRSNFRVSEGYSWQASKSV